MPYPPKKIRQQWDYKVLENLIGGLNVAEDSSALEDNELVSARNIIIQKQRLQNDTGYVTFGDDVVGIAQADYQFTKKNGSSELLLITTETFYRFDEVMLEWEYVSDGTDTTVGVQANAGDTVVTLTDATGFADGDRIGIALDNGVQLKTTISGAPAGNVVTLADAIPVGRTANVGAATVKAVSLSGDLNNHVIGITLPSHDWFVFTNGVDIVKRYDGSTVEDVPNLPSSGNVVCQTLALYNNCLFLINCTEGGTAFPRRIRRSNSADPTDWTTGIAGFDDLYDAEDHLLGAELLGPYLIVYAERSIIRGEFIGTGGINFKFDTMVRGEGVISSTAVADAGDVHYCICQSNIYAYRGGFDLEPVGDKVYYKIFGSQGEMNPSFKHRSFTFYVEELDEVWFFYPSTSSENCDRMLRVNLAEETWAERQFAEAFVGFGFYTSQVNRKWNTLVGSWLQQTWKWNDRTITASSPTTHLMPAVGTKVLEYDYVATLDNGATIPYNVETKDFVSPDVSQRFDMLELQIRGTGVEVHYSIDSGGSWNSLGTITRNTMGRVRMHAQFVFERIRFRFSGTQDLQLRSVGFSYKEESLATY